MLNLNFKIFNEMHMGTNKYGKPFFKDINYITEPKRQTSITWNNNNETKFYDPSQKPTLLYKSEASISSSSISTINSDTTIITSHSKNNEIIVLEYESESDDDDNIDLCNSKLTIINMNLIEDENSDIINNYTQNTYIDKGYSDL
jgi:hypothetical protein